LASPLLTLSSSHYSVHLRDLHSFPTRRSSDLTVKGAKASAVIYSLVETAGANGLSERGYLHIVLSNLPSMDFRQHPELLKDLMRSEEHTSELQSRFDLVCRLLLEKKKKKATAV